MDLSIVLTFHDMVDMKKTILKLFLPLIFLTALATPVQADESYELTLYAGQTIPVGTVTINTYADHLTVHIHTWGGWQLVETHLYVGIDPPAKHSPGKFPFEHDSLGGSYDEYMIDYEDIDPDDTPIVGDSVHIAVHAVVGIWDGCDWQEETGWVLGGCNIDATTFSRGWGAYFEITL